MIQLSGKIVLPANKPKKVELVLIEVRDVSLLDAPSVVIAEKSLHKMDLQELNEIEFDMQIPDVDPRQSLSLRAHLSIDGTANVKAGDLLTTTSCPISATEPKQRITVPVSLV